MNRHIEGLTEAVQAMEKYAARNRKNGTGDPSLIDYAIVAIAAYEAHMRPEVTSVEELQQVPEGTIILSEQGNCWDAIARPDYGNYWREFGRHGVVGSSAIALPARVVHWGGSDA